MSPRSPSPLLFASAATALLLAIPSGCASLTTGDVVAGLGCGARESLCRDQCDRLLGIDGDALAYGDCRDRCDRTQGSVCRPGEKGDAVASYRAD